MAAKANNTTGKNNEKYRQARDEFDALKIEEKAIFLVESAFSMLAHGIESVGNVFSEQINKVYHEEEQEKKEEEKPKRAPRKKTTTRKTSTRKRSTTSRAKKTPPKEEG